MSQSDLIRAYWAYLANAIRREEDKMPDRDEQHVLEKALRWVAAHYDICPKKQVVSQSP